MASFDIDDDFIRKLADLLHETGLSDIELAEGEKRIRISRAAPITHSVVAPAVATSAGANAAPPAASSAPPTITPGTLTSPMVGTVYVAAEPGGTPFVKVGDTVKAGQTVLIIEAMKVMNPIKAPRSGTVVQVYVADAQPVEYGEPLMVID